MPFQGGLKAVVLVDTAQAFLMLAGLLLLCIMGIIRAGGIVYVFETANELGRINFNKYERPTTQHSLLLRYLQIQFQSE